MRQRIPVFLLAVAGLLAGCGGSSTDPIATPLIFEGELVSQGSESHVFTVLSDGLLQVELPRLQEKVEEGATPLGFPLMVGLGVGRPVEGQCSARSSVRASEGDVLVLSLTGADFCVSIFDVGTLLPDQVAEYTVSVSAQ